MGALKAQLNTVEYKPIMVFFVSRFPARASLALILSVLSSVYVLPTGEGAQFFSTTVVAADATIGISSIATQGGQKIIEDPYGKMIVVYVDVVGRLSVTYANSDLSNSSAWAVPFKKTGPVAFKRPAAALVSPSLLQIIVEDGTGVGRINNQPVNIARDADSNIIGLSFGSNVSLDSSGTSRYPAAILAQNGDVLSVWWHNDTGGSKVKAFRWKLGVGWTGLNGSSPVPDDALIDSSNRHFILPNIIQRPDNGHLYVVGNRQESSPQTNIVFNKATFDGLGWSWGVQNLAYETNAARGLFDVPSLAWDPVRQLVVAAYDISFDVKYGVFTLNASDAKVHLDTPVLEIANNEWGNIDVDETTGDYYLLMIDSVNPSTNHDNGRIGYVQFIAGSWTTSLSVIDPDTSNVGISVRRTGSSRSLDIIFSKPGGIYYQIRLARIQSADAVHIFAPTDDATIRLDRPNTAFGATATLEVDGADPVKDFLVKFTLSGLRSHPILGATFRLYSTDSTPVGGLFYTSSSAWSESNVTWNNAPPRDTTLVASLRSVAVGVWYEVDVTSAVAGDGVLSFRVTANSTDGAVYSSREGLNPPELVVSMENRPPEIAPISNPTILEQSLFALVLTATDVDGDPLAWGLDAGAPAGLILTPDGNLSWSPGEEHGPGSFTITVRVTDGVFNDVQTVVLSVVEVNLVPTVLVPGAFLVYETQTLSFVVSASDPDVPANALSLSASGLPEEANFSPSTGSFSWIPGLGQAGTYLVNFTATDNGSPALSNMKTANITVVIDTSVPAFPSLLLSVSNFTSTSLALNWTAAVDNVGISGYRIYRNGELLATVAGASTAYTVSGLSPNTTYSFLVQAIDPSNNLSVENPAASATTLPSPGGSGGGGGGGRIYLM